MSRVQDSGSRPCMRARPATIARLALCLAAATPPLPALGHVVSVWEDNRDLSEADFLATSTGGTGISDNRPGTAVSIAWSATYPEQVVDFTSSPAPAVIGDICPQVLSGWKSGTMLPVSIREATTESGAYYQSAQSINGESLAAQDSFFPALDAAQTIGDEGATDQGDRPLLFKAAEYRAALAPRQRARVRGGLLSDAELKVLIDNAPLLPGEALKGMPLAALLANALKGIPGKSGTMVLPKPGK